ncbi:hypothetical protein C0J52_14994, partial [Blattella germanica]
NNFLQVVNYSPNFEPPDFAASRLVKKKKKKKPTRQNGRSHCLHLYVGCLPLMRLLSFFYTHNTHF